MRSGRKETTGQEMRAKFAIDRRGVVVNPADRPAQRSYIHVERRGQLLQISLNRYAPVPALLALIRHIRMVDGRISLLTELPILGERKRLTVADACLSLGRYAMLRLEQQKKHCFQSHLSLWGAVDQNDASIPAEMMSLGQIRLSNLDTPSALARLNEVQMQPMAFFSPNAELKMILAKPPAGAVWPRKLTDNRQPVSEIVPDPFALWLQIVYETSLSVRQPLLHFGQMLLPSLHDRKDQLQPFRRLVMPISAKTERPSNYRVLTAAVRLPDGAWIL